MKPKSLRVCVIGAGPSGLTAVKELLDEGHQVTCLERTDRAGGVFSTGVSYRDMRLTVSQYFMAFSSLAPPLEEERRHWSRDEYMAYLELFCDRFNLKNSIHFNADCESIHRQDDSFVVNYKLSNEPRKEQFDALAICKGAFRAESPRLPSIPGLETFKGEIVHTAAYKGPAPFKGKRVVCVGMGETSADVTMQISDVAQTCWLSIRKYPNLIARRPYGFGDTNDALTCRLALWLPITVRNQYFEAFKETDRRSSDPRRRLVGEWWQKSGGFGNFLQKNDDFVPNVLDGRIKVVPHGISRIAGSTVEFTDGTRVECDALMLCTGYEESSIPHEWIDGPKIDDVRGLFKQAFHPDLGARLAFIGWARPFQGGVPACSEMISRYFALLCSGKLEFPSRSVLEAQIAADADKANQFFSKSKTRTLVEYQQFMESTAELVDCRPRVTDYVNDPEFLYKLLCGSNVCFCYRLRGPHADPATARKVIMRLPVVHQAVPGPDLVKQALNGRVDADRIPEVASIVHRYATATMDHSRRAELAQEPAVTVIGSWY